MSTGDKSKKRSARKDARGLNARRKAGLPAKAGKRKMPSTPGKHITTAFDRKRGMRLASVGVAFYVRPAGWIDRAAKQSS